MKVKNTPGIRTRESSTSYNTKKKMDGSKRTGRKVDYAAAFAVTSRRSLHSHS